MLSIPHSTLYLVHLTTYSHTPMSVPHLYVHLPIYPSIQPTSGHPSIYPTNTYPSTHSTILPSIIYLSNQLASTHLPISHLSIHPFIRPSKQLTHTSLLTHLSTQQMSIHSPTHPPNPQPCPLFASFLHSMSWSR